MTRGETGKSPSLSSGFGYATLPSPTGGAQTAFCGAHVHAIVAAADAKNPTRRPGVVTPSARLTPCG